MSERIRVASLSLLLASCDVLAEPSSDAPAEVSDPPPPSAPEAAPPETKAPAVEAKAPELVAAPARPPLAHEKRLRGTYRVTKLTQPGGDTWVPAMSKVDAPHSEVLFSGIHFGDASIEVRVQCLMQGDFTGKDKTRRYYTVQSAASSTFFEWGSDGPVLPAQLSMVAESSVIERIGTSDGQKWQIDWATDSKECSIGLEKGNYVQITLAEANGRPSKARLEDPAGRVWELEAVEDWLTKDEVKQRINAVAGKPQP